MAVVRLGALCELDSATASQANFRVSEYAVLDDGSEVVLHSDPGFSAGVHGGEDADIWKHMTATWIESDVLAMVLPDDAEQTGEDHRGNGSLPFSPALAWLRPSIVSERSPTRCISDQQCSLG